MNKTAAQITKTVLEKLAKIYYRGMADTYIDDVLRDGLPEGISLASNSGVHNLDEALQVARHYAQVGASNILNGDTRYVKNLPAHYTKSKALLESLGVTPRDASFEAPLLRPMHGGVIKVDLPDDIAAAYAPRGGVLPTEHHAVQAIPAQYISKFEGGYKGLENQVPVNSMTRLTRQDMRLIAAAVKRNRTPEVKDIVTRVQENNPWPDIASPEITDAEAMGRIRKYRRGRTQALRELLNGPVSHDSGVPRNIVDAADNATKAVGNAERLPGALRRVAPYALGAAGLAGGGYGLYKYLNRDLEKTSGFRETGWQL